jgi:hypothetical protein
MVFFSFFPCHAAGKKLSSSLHAVRALDGGHNQSLKSGQGESQGKLSTTTCVEYGFTDVYNPG